MRYVVNILHFIIVNPLILLSLLFCDELTTFQVTIADNDILKLNFDNNNESLIPVGTMLVVMDTL